MTFNKSEDAIVPGDVPERGSSAEGNNALTNIGSGIVTETQGGPGDRVVKITPPQGGNREVVNGEEGNAGSDGPIYPNNAGSWSDVLAASCQ